MSTRPLSPSLSELTETLNQAYEEKWQDLECAFRKRTPADDSLASRISHFFTNLFSKEMRAAKDQAVHTLYLAVLSRYPMLMVDKRAEALHSLVRDKFDELEQKWIQKNVFAPDANAKFVASVDNSLQKAKKLPDFQRHFNYLKPKNTPIFPRIASFFSKIFYPKKRLFRQLTIDRITYDASKQLGVSAKDTGLYARIRVIVTKRFDRLLAEKNHLGS